HQVMQPAGRRVANVHAGPFAHVLQVGEVLQILGVVLRVGDRLLDRLGLRASGLVFARCLMGFFAHNFFQWLSVGWPRNNPTRQRGMWLESAASLAYASGYLLNRPDIKLQIVD